MDVDIRRVHQQGSIAGYFGHRGDVRCEHRHAARHGIQHRHAEAFVERGEREDGRALVKFFELRSET